MRFVARVLLLIICINWIPTAAYSTPEATENRTYVPLPSAIVEQAYEPLPDLAAQIPPWVDPQLPSLVVQVEMADNLRVGDTAPFSITIINQAPHPVIDLSIAIPPLQGVIILWIGWHRTWCLMGSR